MKTPFPLHWLFGAVAAVALAAMLTLALSGCDKKPSTPAKATSSAALPSSADEAQAKQDADARRKQFFGDGPHYTPQPVKGF